MTDEVNDQGNESTYTEVEQHAMEMGWKPKDQYEGDPAKFRSAELYVELRPFFEKIENLSKQNKQHQKNLQQIAKDTFAIREQEYQRAVKSLKAERKAASEEGDFDRVELINDQIDNYKEERQQHQQAVQQQVQAAPDTSELEAWSARNTWYERDEDLKDWADARGVRLAKSGIAPSEVLSTLEKEVKAKFPTKFTNPNRDKAGAVEAGSRSNARADRVDMPEEHRRIMDTIVRSGAMTREQYLKEYKESNKE